MSLRTAPCPTCKSTIVFGERRCRSCGMPFDYGAAPPPEPTAAQVFDTLSLLGAPPSTPPSPNQPSQPPRPAPPPVASSTPPRQANTDAMPGLDTGRYEVGEVEIEDVPGFMDSTLFKSMTPDHVDAAPIPGLEITSQSGGDAAVRPEVIPGLEGRAEDVGEVFPAAIPGLFGSDLFQAGVDVAAGAGASSEFLDVTPNAGRVIKDKDHGKVRTICATCSSVHFLSRCPSCGTAAPGRE